MPLFGQLPVNPYTARCRSARFHVAGSDLTLNRLQMLPEYEQHPMFHEQALMQARCPDLFFYDCTLEQVVPFP